jgi:hypothetical protein
MPAAAWHSAFPAGLASALRYSMITRVRTSMLSRGAASAGVSGRVKALCGVKRARPSGIAQKLLKR